MSEMNSTRAHTYVHEEQFDRHIVRVTGVPWTNTAPKGGAEPKAKDFVLTLATLNRCRELAAYTLLFGDNISFAGRACAFIRQALEVEPDDLAKVLGVDVAEIQKIESDTAGMTAAVRERFLTRMRWYVTQDIGTEDPPTFERTEFGNYFIWTIPYQ